MSANQFLQQRAVDIALLGRYRLPNWYDHNGKRREFACRTTRVSPFRMLVSVPVIGKIGDRVACYFSDFGNLDGRITDTVEGGFLLDLDVDQAKREMLADKLTWLEKKRRDPEVQDTRAHERIIPRNPHSKLVFADGTHRSCFVIDMSASGAAVSAEVQPEMGMPLAVGSCVGRVVRHLREGFAVQFVELQNARNLERLVIRPV